VGGNTPIPPSTLPGEGAWNTPELHQVRAAMTRVLYLDCIGGIAGDMLLGALVDAGAPVERLLELPRRLALGDVRIDVERVERQGVGALHVRVSPSTSPPRRTWRAMRETIENADLEEKPRALALRVLDRLAKAEAAVHGRPVEEVHFHELGGEDTLVDVCGAALLLGELSIACVVCSPLPYSRGITAAAHGLLPIPAPATVELLRGAQVHGVEGSKELVTPTGAALAVEVAESFGPPPLLSLQAVGYGAGSDDTPDRPNVLRVLVGEGREIAATDVVLLETNLDDLSPELVPDAVERCFAAGALDVWTVPAAMKKGRPGIVLSALARPAVEQTLAAVILEQTSALGVRVQLLRRYELEREHRVVQVAGHDVRVKIARLDGRVVNVAPEHDDCAAIAEQTGRAVKSVWAEALARAHDT
jgi:pyridinium-3,5-bisthiocarboxylic acid mononucleotide nickel chelatase